MVFYKNRLSFLESFFSEYVFTVLGLAKHPFGIIFSTRPFSQSGFTTEECTASDYVNNEGIAHSECCQPRTEFYQNTRLDSITSGAPRFSLTHSTLSVLVKLEFIPPTPAEELGD